ncbi:MAG: segregation/condensation protein A [Gemmatimonadota bacterium]|nr:segregation/condensation protein A [Gemmatimonadota bacterium]
MESSTGQDVTEREAERPRAAGAPATATAGGESFFVELERFRGPLDLLLHLIRSQDIDIFDIPIARITRQFQVAIGDGLAGMPLERAGEFLEMAATLVRIKAQLLLPRPEPLDWEEDPRAELVRRLLEYEHFQDVVHVLQTAESQRGRHFARGYVEPRPPPRLQLPPLETTLEDLLRAAAAMPRPRPAAAFRAPSRPVTVEEKVSLLRGLLARARRVAFDRLVRPWGTRAHAVAALLAALELARRQVLRIEQASAFGRIWLFPVRAPRAAGAAGSTETGTAEEAE